MFRQISLEGNGLLILAGREIEQKSTNIKDKWDNEQLHPVP